MFHKTVSVRFNYWCIWKVHHTRQNFKNNSLLWYVALWLECAKLLPVDQSIIYGDPTYIMIETSWREIKTRNLGMGHVSSAFPLLYVLCFCHQYSWTIRDEMCFLWSRFGFMKPKFMPDASIDPEMKGRLQTWFTAQ